MPTNKPNVPGNLGALLAALEHPPTNLREMPRWIDMCQAALTLVDRDMQPLLWADLEFKLGSSLLQNPLGNRADNIERAIQHYQEALAICTREDYPDNWAMIHHNLAGACYTRVAGDHAKNVEQAIAHYELAEEVLTRDRVPELWASIQRGLALAYWARNLGDIAENVERAISYCERALEASLWGYQPVGWATTHHNLAMFYRDRIRGERAENIELAIEHNQYALQVRTREAYPEAWAETTNNLAIAFMDRLRGDRADNVEQAIACFQQALEVRTQKHYPELWAETMCNLALAYRNRIRGEHAKNIEQAIAHFEQALEVFTQEAFPEKWARTLNNLVGIYCDLRGGDRADNIEQAIRFCHQALGVYTQGSFPEQWGATQHFLGNVYAARLRGDPAENLKQATSHYEQALIVRTREAFPAEYRQTQRGLGDLYFSKRRWHDAWRAFEEAIMAGADLLAAAYSEVGRQAEVRETAQLYARSAYCLLQTGQPGAAMVMHEHGKTRLLAEALALADADVGNLAPKHQQAIQQAREAVRALEAEMRLPPNAPTRRDDRILADQLRQTRADLSALIDSIRRKHPDFMFTGLDLKEILVLIPENSALLAPLVTSQGSAVFVVPHGVRQVTEEHVVRLDGFKEDDLSTILRGPADDPHWGGWMGAYVEFRRSGTVATKEAWLTAIERLTGELWEKMLAPVNEQLQALGIRHVILVPSGGLQLLPLHAAWRIVEGKKRHFLDDYDVVYAPSAYALDSSRRRVVKHRGSGVLVAGVNAYHRLPPLSNACAEATAVAEIFGGVPLLDDAATRKAVMQGMPGKGYLHLSCHGEFAWGGNPLASALYLAADEPLTLTEILSGTLDLSSNRLVTLSACETGITDIRQSPDEHVGLPAGLLQAGAPAVVSSLWTVDDRSTALLMERFYKNHLEKGLSPPQALQEAQLWLRDETSFNHPFYWAAFTFTGA